MKDGRLQWKVGVYQLIYAWCTCRGSLWKERERVRLVGFVTTGCQPIFLTQWYNGKHWQQRSPWGRESFFSTASVSTAEYICPWCTCRGSHWIERDWGRWGATMVCSGGVSQPYAQFAQDKPIFETRNYCMCPARQGKVRLNQPCAQFTPNKAFFWDLSLYWSWTMVNYMSNIPIFYIF